MVELSSLFMQNNAKSVKKWKEKTKRLKFILRKTKTSLKIIKNKFDHSIFD